MSNHDDIENACRYFLIGIGRTKNDIIGNIICQGMVIADDNQVIVLLSLITVFRTQYTIFGCIREFLALNDVISTNNISVIDICNLVIVSINHIILSTIFIDIWIKPFILMIQVTSQLIVNTNNL